MDLVDSHCHLSFSPLVEDLDGVLFRAHARGVTRTVVPAYDAASWNSISEISKRTGVYGAFGIHPWVAEHPFDEDALHTRLSSGAVAVGHGHDTGCHGRCGPTRGAAG